jgi:glyceraldehyde 3-phosphate dehydrogenase
MMRIAINGFGRIGRNFLRTICADPHAKNRIAVVVINIGPADPHAVAHMFKYDTLLGAFPANVAYADGILSVDDLKIKVIAQCDAKALNWSAYAIDWVVDASGRYTTPEAARLHLDAGAKYTLITAPCKGDIPTIVPGVNDDTVDLQKNHIFSLASCTTNAVAPMLKVLHEAFEIEQAFMTTVHAYTNSQVLIDVEAEDLRTSRAAALNIIPTKTGASRAIELVLPILKGKVLATSIRVPVAKVSLIDLTICTKKAMTVDAVNGAFDRAAQADLKGIMQVSREQLVSSDFSGCPASVVIDALLTQADGAMSKTFGWYDNEWGYSTRLKDFLLRVEK